MAHREGPDGRGVVVAYADLVGVEAHALADDCFGVAGGAPYCEGHLEADGRRPGCLGVAAAGVAVEAGRRFGG